MCNMNHRILLGSNYLNWYNISVEQRHYIILANKNEYLAGIHRRPIKVGTKLIFLSKICVSLLSRQNTISSTQEMSYAHLLFSLKQRQN